LINTDQKGGNEVEDRVDLLIWGERRGSVIQGSKPDFWLATSVRLAWQKDELPDLSTAASRAFVRFTLRSRPPGVTAIARFCRSLTLEPFTFLKTRLLRDQQDLLRFWRGPVTVDSVLASSGED